MLSLRAGARFGDRYRSSNNGRIALCGRFEVGSEEAV